MQQLSLPTPSSSSFPISLAHYAQPHHHLSKGINFLANAMQSPCPTIMKPWPISLERPYYATQLRTRLSYVHSIRSSLLREKTEAFLRNPWEKTRRTSKREERQREAEGACEASSFIKGTSKRRDESPGNEETRLCIVCAMSKARWPVVGVCESETKEKSSGVCGGSVVIGARPSIEYSVVKGGAENERMRAKRTKESREVLLFARKL